MHHVIWVEHDGSWTWSIEEGKAFEDDHKVLARDDGFPTRGDAKEDMQKAWAKLIDEGKRPGKLSDLKKTKTSGKATTTKKSTTTAKQTSAKAAPPAPATLSPVPEWAVVVDGELVAVFVKKADADKFGKANHAKSHTVTKVGIGFLV